MLKYPGTDIYLFLDSKILAMDQGAFHESGCNWALY